MCPAAWSRTLTVTLHSRIACDDGQVSTPTPEWLKCHFSWQEHEESEFEEVDEVPVNNMGLSLD